MENREDPRIAEDISSEEQEEKYAFLQETRKDEKKRGKIRKSTVIKCTVLGLVFGMAASLGFFALKPWAERVVLGDPDEVTIPEEEEHEEDTDEEKEQQALVVSMDHYREMNAALTEVADEVQYSVAAITGGKESSVEEEPGSTADECTAYGIIAADNGQEFLIFGSIRPCEQGGKIQVTFADGKSYTASVKQTDKNLGFAVYAVQKSRISSATLEQIRVADLGRSGTVGQGDTVIAMGDPLGCGDSLGFGVVAAVNGIKSKADGEYRLIQTDISGSVGGTGVLADIDGKIIGVIDGAASEDEAQVATAYGISELKTMIECMSNGEPVPYLGITGVSVTEEIAGEQGIPQGVYVRQIEPDSPAMEGGIQSGDIITEVEKTKVTTVSGYRSALLKKASGQRIRIKGMRKGTDGYVSVEYDVTVGSNS